MASNIQLTKKSLGQTFGIFFAVFFAIIIPVFSYTSRSVSSRVASFPWNWSIPLIAAGWVGAVILSLGVAAIYTIGWRLSWLKPGYTNVPRLLLAVFCASAIAHFAPVLPTTEQLYFEQHKSEFDHQVELVKQGHAAKTFGNLRIDFNKASNFIVFEYFADNVKSVIDYVYAENYSDVANLLTCSATDGSGGLGQIYATLSTNWYLCYRTG